MGTIHSQPVTLELRDTDEFILARSPYTPGTNVKMAGDSLKTNIITALGSTITSASQAAVATELAAAVESVVTTQIGISVPAAVSAAINSSLPTAVSSSVATAVNAAIATDLPIAVSLAIQDSVPAAVVAQFEAQLPTAVSIAVNANLSANLPSQIASGIESALGSVIEPAINTALAAELPGAVATAIPPVVTAVVNSAVPTAVTAAVGPAVNAAVSGSVPPAVNTAVLAAMASLLPIQLGDVYGLTSVLSGKAEATHTHAITDVVGLMTALSDKVSSASLVRTFTAVAAPSLNTAVRLSTTKDAFVNYTVDVTTTITLTTGQTGTVSLHYADDAAMTTNVVEVSRALVGNTGVLTVGLSLAQTVSTKLTGIIPAGKYRSIVTINTVGTPTFTSGIGQEVLF